jgi:hypothetical protein
MTLERAMFATLGAATARRLERLPMPPGWGQVEALAPFSNPAAVLAAISAPVPPASRRPVLRSLLALAPADRLAAEVFLAGLVPALRAVSAELARSWPAERDEVDALLALGAWEAICALGGRELAWPDRTVVGQARDRARSALRASARYRAREGALAERPQALTGAGDGTGAVVAADLVRRAVATGSVTASAARLVWAARVHGMSSAELAAERSRSAESVSMERLRAERALRALVA